MRPVSPEWLIYASIVMAGLCAALAVVGLRRALNIRHLASLYLAVMLVTYLLRPVVVTVFGGGFWFVDKYFYAYSHFTGYPLLLMGCIVALTLVSFALGYRKIRRPPIEASDACVLPVPREHTVRAVWSAAIMIVVGYASFAVSQRGFVGVWGNQLTYTMHEGMGAYGNSNGYFEMSNYLVVTGALLLFAATNRLWLVGLVSAPWFYNQLFFGWSRHKALVLVAGVLAVEVLRGGRMLASKARLFVTLGTTCLVLLMLVAMRQNRFFLSEGQGIAHAASDTFSLPIDRATGDLDGFEPTWVTMHQVGSLDKTYGLDILYTNLIVLIPRQIWPGKPWPTDFTWHRVFHVGEPVVQDRWPIGAVRGTVGDALQQWGWPGLFINFYLTGLMLAWAERRYRCSPKTPAVIAGYGAAYALLPLLGRDTIWHVLPDYLYLFTAPYLLVDWWICRAAVAAAPSPALGEPLVAAPGRRRVRPRAGADR